MREELIELQEVIAPKLDSALETLASLRLDMDAKLTEALHQRDKALVSLYDAKKLNAAMQDKHAVGTPEWHAHETIDDRLHDVSCYLGD